MYPRLYIAKQLLREDGVIFISIDDNEVSQLKLMMDEIFGEENFVTEFIWKSRQNKDNRSITGASVDHEYILCYSKQNGTRILKGSERKTDQYTNPDNDPRGDWASGNMAGILPKHLRPNCHYDLINPKTKINYGMPTMGWRYEQSTMDRLIAENRVIWPTNKDGRPRRKVFIKELSDRYTGFSSIMGTDIFTRNGTKEIDGLFKFRAFDFPKPSSLISELISQVVNNEFIVLDFFAGSGTTGDAVMQSNARDGGSRRYILIQIPESIDAKKDKAVYDFATKELKAEPTIFEITKERLLRAAKKINQELDEKNKELEAKIKTLKAELPTEETKEEIDLFKEEIRVNNQVQTQNNFKIFGTMPIWEDYHFEAKELDEQLELFDETKLTEEDLQALLITWKTYDGIPLTENLKEIDLSGYKAFYAKDKLYLMHKGFTTDGLKALLERIDSDKFFNPTSIIVFGYHFESKSLRELAENLKSYSNKKNIDIDFITRY